jgi:hydroxymethylglutaryl-CoA lyase
VTTNLRHPEIEIVDVTARDGLQNLTSFVPTDKKVALIRQIVAAGVRRLEIGSFVSPHHVPQMRDVEAVVTAVGPLPGVVRLGLVPNQHGALRAMAAGLDHLVFVISMSDAHNISNVRRPTAASIADLRDFLERHDPEQRLHLRIGIATAFHCPFDGDVDPSQVMRHIEEIVALRPGLELTISDTTGKALPPRDKALCSAAIARGGDRARFTFHGHDTAGFGIANVLAALDAGIVSFDGATGGLGGCPFAPGATGNIATEDLVFLFERLGLHTGIDLAALLAVADIAAALPQAQPGGHIRGLPRATVGSEVAHAA